MKIYRREFNSSLGQLQLIETDIEVVYKSAVDTLTDLPTSDNSEGDLRIVLDTDHIYAYVSSAWVDQGVLGIDDLLRDQLMQSLS